MFIQEILRQKGTQVYTIGPEATLEDVVDELVRHNIGSLVVCQAGGEEASPMGIITERDLLRASAQHKCHFRELKVRDVMSVDLVVASPRDDAEAVMGMMTVRRVRHLPIVDNGRLLGVISIGDVVKSQHQQMAIENQYMREYIQS